MDVEMTPMQRRFRTNKLSTNSKQQQQLEERQRPQGQAALSFPPPSGSLQEGTSITTKGSIVALILLVGVLITYWLTRLEVLFAPSPQLPPKQKNFNQEPMLGQQDTMMDVHVPSLATKLELLTVVTMNVAGCVPSQEAPKDWNRDIATQAIRKEVLRTNPDILALQECPGDVSWAQDIFGDDQYQVLGSTPAHADQIILMVRRGSNIQAKSVPLLPPEYRNMPAVMAELQWHDRRLLVASVHLAPFREGSFERQDQVESLLQKASSLSLPIIFAGDTNMRSSEDETMEEAFGLIDVWKLSGSDEATEFSWDTMNHTTFSGGSWNRYYGKKTRQYTARYDRIYCSRHNAIDEVEVASFGLIANQPLTSRYHFLSDHFGISAKLKLTWKGGDNDTN